MADKQAWVWEVILENPNAPLYAHSCDLVTAQTARDALDLALIQHRWNGYAEPEKISVRLLAKG